jgi:hypothetical protein
MEIISSSEADAVSRVVDSIYMSYLHVADVASRHLFIADTFWAVEEILPLILYLI